MGVDSPNGIAVHLNGSLYVTSSGGKIYRVDPVANTYDIVIEYSDYPLNGITFSPDYQTLYFNEESGFIHKAAVNPDGTLQPDEILTYLEQGTVTTLLNGMAADSCGNVYTADMAGVIWRITPSGETELAVEITDEQKDSLNTTITAVNFGSGYGGWKRNHLYTISYTGNIHEVDIGVTGKPEPHL